MRWKMKRIIDWIKYTLKHEIQWDRLTEWCIGLFLLVSAAAPIVLYHLEVVSIYNVMVSDEVAAYFTAIYVTAMLAFKMVNDIRRDKSQYNMSAYRDKRARIDASGGDTGGRETAGAYRDLFAARAYDRKTRIVRYLGLWISYMFVSVSHGYVRSALGC